MSWIPQPHAHISSYPFNSRREIIATVCDRLSEYERFSTCIVGGPKTGRTILLRELVSDDAVNQFPILAQSYNVLFQGGVIALFPKF